MSDADPLYMWVVYNPDVTHQSYRAIEYKITPSNGAEPAGGSMHAPDVEMIRALLRRSGLFQIDRHPTDDPTIVETWT